MPPDRINEDKLRAGLHFSVDPERVHLDTGPNFKIRVNIQGMTVDEFCKLARKCEGTIYYLSPFDLLFSLYQRGMLPLSEIEKVMLMKSVDETSKFMRKTLGNNPDFKSIPIKR